MKERFKASLGLPTYRISGVLYILNLIFPIPRAKNDIFAIF